MGRAAALTPTQDRQLRERVRAGADIPALVTFAKQKRWKVGRTTLGNLYKDERERPSAAAPGAETPTLESVAARLARLEARIDSLTMPEGLKLSQVLIAAVEKARQLLATPDIDPAGAAKIMAQLPDLAEAARKALETEQGSGDDELGL